MADSTKKLRRGEQAPKKKKPSLRKDTLDFNAANRATDNISEPGKALRRGLLQTNANLREGAGAVAGALGAEQFALKQNKTAQGLRREAAQFTPRVSRFEDVHGIGDAAQLVANTVAEQAPNLAVTAAGALLGRGAGRALGAAGKTAKTAAALGGGTAAGTALEAGSIQGDLLGDKEARKTNSVQDLSQTALGFGTGAGLLDALPVTRVFNKFGVGKAGKRAIGSALHKRLGKEIAKGAAGEALTEAGQTTVERAARKFANKNFEVFGDQGIRDIVESAGLGAIGGGAFGSIGALAPDTSPEGRLNSRMEDLAAQDELDQAHSQAAPVLQADQADGGQGVQTTRIAAGHFNKPIGNIQQFNSEVAPVLRAVASGEIAANDPKVQTFLADNFDQPEQMLDRIAKTVGAEPVFELNALVDAVDGGDLNLSDALPEGGGTVGERIRKLGGEQALGDTLGGAARDIFGEDAAPKGEAGPEFQSIQESTPGEAQTQGTFLSKDAVRKDGQRFADDSGAKRLRAANEKALGPDKINDIRREFKALNERAQEAEAQDPAKAKRLRNRAEALRKDLPHQLKPLSETVREEAKAQGAKTEPQIQEFVAQRAQQLAKENPQLASEGVKPEDFLRNFNTLVKQPQAEITDTGDTQAVNEVDLRDDNVIRKASQTGKALPRGDIGVTIDGKPANVNVMQLAKQMQRKLPFKEGQSQEERVGELVNSGLASLLNMEGKDVQLAENTIPAETVVFTTRQNGRKREFTFGEISKGRGAAAVRGRAEATQAEFEAATASPKAKRGVAQYKELAAQRKELQAKLPDNPSRDNPLNQQVIAINKRIGALRKDPEVNRAITATLEREGLRRSFKAKRAAEHKQTADRFQKAKQKVKEARSAEAFAAKREQRTDEGGDFETGPDRLTDREGERKLDARGNDTRVQFDRGQEGKQREALGQVSKLDNKTRRQTEQRVAQKWLSMLGVDTKVELLSVEDAAVLTAKTKQLDKFLKGGFRGFTVKAKPGAKVIQIYVDPRVKGAGRLATLAHEVGHQILNQTAATMSAAQSRAIKDAFETWRESFGRSATAKDVLVSRRPFAALVDMLNTKGVENRLSDLSPASRDYLLDFEEWFADNASKWLNTKAEPRSVVEQFFANVGELLRDLWAAIRNDHPDATVAEYLNSLLPTQEGFPSAEGIDVQELSAEDIQFDEDFDDKDNLFGNINKRSAMFRRIEKIIKKFKKSEQAEDSEVEIKRLVWTTLASNEDPYGAAENASMRHAFAFLLSPKEKGILTRTFTSSAAMRRLRELLNDDPQALEEINSDPNAAAAYGYQFWRAGELSIGPQTKDVFEKIVAVIKNLLGVISDSDQSEQILTAFQNGAIRRRFEGKGTFAVTRRLRNTRLQRAARAGEQISDSVRPFISKLFYTADGQMRATENAWLIKLTELVHPAVGTENVKETMFEARTRMTGRFTNILRDIFDGQDQAFGQRVVELLQNPKLKPANDAEAKAVERSRKLLRQLLNYQRAAGIKVGDRGANFFPRIVDTDHLQRHHDEFIEALAQNKYDEHLAKIEQTVGGKNLTQTGRVKAAERIYEAYMKSFGDTDAAGADAERISSGAGAPFNASAHARTLGWIDQADIAPFLSKDLGQTLTRYIDQSVKRAEYARRFNEDGSKLKEILAKARETGASPQDMERADKYIKAMMGTLGADMDPRLQKAQGAVMVYQNLRLLTLSTLSSLVDPIGIAVRGDLDGAWTALKAGLKEAHNEMKGEQSELHALGEMLGTIDQYMANEALGWEYGGHFLTGRARRINEAFFRVIQLQRWTRLTRLMGLAGAQSFLAKHADGQGKHSKRFLAQLDLKVGDVKVVDGKPQILTNTRRHALEQQDTDAAREELARDDRVRAALNRWVNEAILRPDAAQRPIWASDPRWALVFHLKSFMYSFHDRILKRVSSEFEEGNAAPLLYLQGFIPVMIGVTWFKDLLKGSLGDDDDDLGLFGTVDKAAARAGLNGMWQIGRDAISDVKYGGTGLESFAGPTAQQVTDLLRLPTSGSQAQLKTLIRSLPANNLWREWVT